MREYASAEIQQRGPRVVRARLIEFAGENRFELRAFEHDQASTLGISLATAALPRLHLVLGQLVSTAIADGLLTTDDYARAEIPFPAELASGTLLGQEANPSPTASRPTETALKAEEPAAGVGLPLAPFTDTSARDLFQPS